VAYNEVWQPQELLAATGDNGEDSAPGELGQEGWGIRSIAAALNASPAAVCHWLATALRGGPQEVRPTRIRGRPPS